MTLVLLTAPTDIDTAAGKRNAGIAGEFLRDLIDKYKLIDEKVDYLYCSEVNLAKVFLEYTHILAVGKRPADLLQLRHMLYTDTRLKAKLISVPEHTIATDLRYQTYDEEDDEAEDKDNGKEDAPTRPLNYAYWIEEGIKKLYRPIERRRDPKTVVKPILAELSGYLSQAFTLFVDIETRRNYHTFDAGILDCIGIGRDTDDTVIILPIYKYDSSLAYSQREILEIHSLLVSAFLSKLIVCHNAMFDLTVLSLFMALPIPSRCADTMLMHHRLAPEVEKSLGHLIGQYTDQMYHKNLLQEASNNERLLYNYNALDVIGTKMIYYRMLEEINQDIGLISAHRVSCESIVTYLHMQSTGLLVDNVGLSATKLLVGNDVTRIEEIVDILAGHSLNVGSTQQLTTFLHEEHQYKVVAHSPLTKRPSLGKKQLQQLAVRTRNPIIPLIINAKKLRKSDSMLTFNSL